MQVVLERRTNISVWFYACVFADETGDKEADFFFWGGEGAAEWEVVTWL
jgi:hypothetical protein